MRNALGGFILNANSDQLGMFLKFFIFFYFYFFYFFYQPGMCFMHTQLVLRLLYVFWICLLVCLCTRTYHVHNNYVTYNVHCCHATLLLTAALSTSIATVV